jgi:hypothetical protein
MSFVRLHADPERFVLRLANVLAFDAERRGTRFLSPCPACGAFYDVVGATPAFLRGVREPIERGFFRSDLVFGSGPEQRPLLFVGIRTAEALNEKRFEGYMLRPVQA